MTNALIYVRVSSGIQEDGYSLGFQEDHCRMYATGHGYSVAGVFSDVHTGSEWRERPGLTALRSALAAGGIDVVICYALDRLSRDQTHIAVLVDEIEHHGARLELTTEVFEDSAVGKFIRSAKAFAAEVEREKITARSVDGRRAKVMSGRPTGQGRPLYGYRWRDADKSGWEFDPETEHVARRIYTEALSGTPLRAISKALTEDGIPSPTGRDRWNHSTIRAMLKHPGYSGRAYGWGWTQTASRNGKRGTPIFDFEKAMPLPDGLIPAIVTVPEWEQIQEQLTRNKQRAARNTRHNHEALLRAGLAVCGHCGGTMHVHHQNHRNNYTVYECAARNRGEDCQYHCILVKDLDAAAWERLSAILTNPHIIAREIRRMIDADPVTADLDAIERRLTTLDASRRNLIRQMAAFDDPDDAAAIRAEVESIGRQRRKLEAERAAIVAQRTVWESAESYLADLEAWIGAVAETLDDLTYDQRRSLVEWFGFKATVWRRGHTPRYEITSAIPLDGLYGSVQDVPIVDSNCHRYYRNCHTVP